MDLRSFIHACAESNIEYIKKCIDDGIDFHTQDDLVFRRAIYWNRKQVYKCLYNKSIELNSPIDVTMKADEPFRVAVGNKHLYTARWLVEIYKKIIN